MIVFDLRCAAAHVFEAWFASTGAFEEQRARGLLACPVCGDAAIEKAVMAPNVAAKGNRSPAPAEAKAMLAKLAEAQARVVAKSRWVGPGFAAEARAIHAGEKPDALIHGQATATEVAALVDEGVKIAPLPFPITPPDRVN